MLTNIKLYKYDRYIILRIKWKALFHDGLLSAGKAHKESGVKFAAAVMTVHTM